MIEKVKNILSSKEIPDGFIKVTEKPLGTLTSEQKAILNRKGNILYNQGKYEEARRIFLATGYSDGLTRIGDKYAQTNNELKALKLYLLAHNTKKVEPIYQKIANVMSALIEE